ncbi:MAG: Myotubularin-related protein 6 [Paramarteilia canceri]
MDELVEVKINEVILNDSKFVNSKVQLSQEQLSISVPKPMAFKIWIGLISNLSQMQIQTTKYRFAMVCHSFDKIEMIADHKSDLNALYNRINKAYRKFVPPQNFLTADFTTKLTLDLRSEFLRQDVNLQLWRESQLNESNSRIPSYPSLLYVPKTADLHCLLQCISFRSLGRLPVLTFFWNKNCTALCRSAQPLVGVNSRNSFDEEYISQIQRVNPNGKLLVLLDLRPYLNIIANSATGKGFESEKNYKDIVFKNFALKNIHAIRESYNQLQGYRLSPDSFEECLPQFKQSKWYKNVKDVLKSTQFGMDSMINGHSLLLHCSDGWDRTSQVASLIQILLDPFFRTIKGLLTLIYKDWIAFGHQFTIRTRPELNGADSSEFSPIFLLFLDCLRQIMYHNASFFEYKDSFLLKIHYEMFIGRYETFKSSTEKEFFAKRTNSNCLFNLLINNYTEFINEKYEASLDLPKIKPYDLKPWDSLLKRSINWQ